MFANDCKRGYALLLGSNLGCYHLREHWQVLAATLESRGFWSDDELALAQRLLGAEPAEANLDDSDVWFLRVHNALAQWANEPALEALRTLEHLSGEAAQRLLADLFGSEEPTPAFALAQLRAFVEEQLTLLADRASMHWRETGRAPYVLACITFGVRAWFSVRYRHLGSSRHSAKCGSVGNRPQPISSLGVLRALAVKSSCRA